MQRTKKWVVIAASVVSLLLCKLYVLSAIFIFLHQYPIWYQSIVPDASLYYVGLVICLMISVLVLGICFVAIVGEVTKVLSDIWH